MQALFVHGMGRTQLSGWTLLRYLKSGGVNTYSIGYSVIFESFDQIKARLITQLTILGNNGDYFVIGHSLGGVLLRAAIDSLPTEVRKPCHLFLLASPIKASRWAKRFSENPIFRVIAGDCGQLLASDQRMGLIPETTVSKTAIIGDFKLPFRTIFAPNEINDGILSFSEVDASWLTDVVRIHCLHSFLPFSRSLGEIILERVTD
jgi:hypothetical protein